MEVRWKMQLPCAQQVLLGELFQKAGRKDGGLDGIGGILQDVEANRTMDLR